MRVAKKGYPALDRRPYLGSPELEYRRCFVHVSDITILVQPRRTFGDITELAQTVAKLTYANPPVVAAFTSTTLLDAYLVEASSYWGRLVARSEVTRDVMLSGKATYIINVAGERRLRSALHLFEHGCSQCQQKNLQLTAGDCLSRHFQLGRGIIEARVIVDPDPARCFELQLLENTTQRAVPFAEQAQADALYLQYMRAANPSYTVSNLATATGRSLTTLRKELAFTELPWQIQEAVHERKIAAVIATEIARFRTHVRDVTDVEMIGWMNRAMTLRWNSVEMKEAINRSLHERLYNQQNMLKLMLTPAESATFDRNEWRRIKAMRMSQALQSEIRYIEFLTSQEDLLEDSPLTLPSTSRNTRRFAELLAKLAEKIRLFIPATTLEKILIITNDVQRVTAIIELTHAMGYSNLLQVPEQVLDAWLRMIEGKQNVGGG